MQDLIKPYYIINFFNFFILLLLLNSFLLVDPEIFIFFSISFLIILSINNLSELLLEFFNNNFLTYYYYYIKLYNFQLYNLYELSKYFELNIYTDNFGYYIDYIIIFKTWMNNFYEFKGKEWVYLLKYHYCLLIENFKLELLEFYYNYLYQLSFKTNKSQVIFLNEKILLNYLVNSKNFVSVDQRIIVNKNNTNLLDILKTFETINLDSRRKLKTYYNYSKYNSTTINALKTIILKVEDKIKLILAIKK